MNAQLVFECDDLKKEIFSYCEPKYPVITKDMIEKKLMIWSELDQKRLTLQWRFAIKANLHIRRVKADWRREWKADWILTIAQIQEENVVPLIQ